MDDSPKLKLITTPPALPKRSSFWRVCPKRLDYLPESPCEMGIPGRNQSGKVQDEPSCPWWINSKEHNYCFWRYVQDKSGPDGVMQELVQSELAQLFGWSNTKTHFMLKQAIEELTGALKLYGAMELIQDLNDDELKSIVHDHEFGDFEPIE